MKRIEINCTATHFVPFHKIQILQGNLKDLDASNYLKFKQNILKYGFTSPIHVWVDDDENLLSLDGTQRLRTLTAMENEGYVVPDIPITRIKANSVKDAKKILLSLASNYGTISPDGLFEFIQDLNYGTLKELTEEYTFPTIDFDKLGDEYLKDHTDKPPKKDKKCPHCGENL